MLRAVVTLTLLVLMSMQAQGQKKRSEALGSAERIVRDCPVCPEMVVVPDGEFMMGSAQSERGRLSNEGPQRKVTIKAFAIG
jgi:formylglycine-generating enzyme required for sulfatase activity